MQLRIPPISTLAPPAVVSAIFFLAFSSQVLFLYIEPGPLNSKQAVIFNVLVLCLLVCYARACITNPGRVPKQWSNAGSGNIDTQTLGRTRWCRKCENYKPPRAHHCKVCGRCIPQMDHHCPWTVNCVSHTTLPHFIRFLFYAVAALLYLEYFLYKRASILWINRRLPSYLGPTFTQLTHLITLVVINSFTLFALSILLVRTLWNIAANTTTIEGWEIERHETLLRRARKSGGYLDGPGGVRIKIVRQEFPYDIGIWKNVKQGMGTGNIIAWFWPLAASPTNESGLQFEVNEFEDPSTSWPPPDPDRMPRTFSQPAVSTPFTYEQNQQDEIDAFRQRQQADLQRWNHPNASVQRRKPFHARFTEDQTGKIVLDEGASEKDYEGSGEEGWRNSEGERLGDFGVDEQVEFYDEEDMPLSKLLEKRRAAGKR